MQRMAKGQKAGRRTHPLVLLAWEGKKRGVVIPGHLWRHTQGQNWWENRGEVRLKNLVILSFCLVSWCH